jgi:hypothetical protein
MKKINIFYIVIGLLLLGLFIFSDKGSEDSNITDTQENLNNQSENYFVENPITSPIEKRNNYSFTYYFNGHFYTPERQKFVEAFKIISEKTKNHFIFSETTVKEDADFILNYSQEMGGEGDFVTLGESPILGKDYYPYYQNYPDEITISDRQFGTCGDYPSIDIHEILHGLGLDHSKNEDNMMYETNYCQKIDSESVKNLYNEWEIEETV